MKRPGLAALLAAAALMTAVPAATAHSNAEVEGKIVLRLRAHSGAWKPALSVKLHKLVLSSFSVCGIWNSPAGEAFDCATANSRPLPSGTVLRLEQNPKVAGGNVTKKGGTTSKGWGLIGLSTSASVGAVISNVMTGDHRGTFHYRATLRDRASNRILLTSNPITLTWR